MTSTVSTAKKSRIKLFIILSLGILIPVLLIAIVFLAAKSDQNTQQKYDKIRQEQAEKSELQKQQKEVQQSQMTSAHPHATKS